MGLMSACGGASGTVWGDTLEDDALDEDCEEPDSSAACTAAPIRKSEVRAQNKRQPPAIKYLKG
jgi:hypothetical protein